MDKGLFNFLALSKGGLAGLAVLRKSEVDEEPTDDEKQGMAVYPCVCCKDCQKIHGSHECTYDRYPVQKSQALSKSLPMPIMPPADDSWEREKNRRKIQGILAKARAENFGDVSDDEIDRMAETLRERHATRSDRDKVHFKNWSDYAHAVATKPSKEWPSEPKSTGFRFTGVTYRRGHKHHGTNEPIKSLTAAVPPPPDDELLERGMKVLGAHQRYHSGSPEEEAELGFTKDAKTGEAEDPETIKGFYQNLFDQLSGTLLDSGVRSEAAKSSMGTLRQRGLKLNSLEDIRNTPPHVLASVMHAKPLEQKHWRELINKAKSEMDKEKANGLTDGYGHRQWAELAKVAPTRAYSPQKAVALDGSTPDYDSEDTGNDVYVDDPAIPDLRDMVGGLNRPDPVDPHDYSQYNLTRTNENGETVPAKSIHRFAASKAASLHRAAHVFHDAYGDNLEDVFGSTHSKRELTYLLEGLPGVGHKIASLGAYNYGRMISLYPREGTQDAENAKQWKWDGDPTIDLHGRKFHARFGTSNSNDEGDVIFSMRKLGSMLRKRFGKNYETNIGASEATSYASRSQCPNADPVCANCFWHNDCKTAQNNENPNLIQVTQTGGGRKDKEGEQLAAQKVSGKRITAPREKKAPELSDTQLRAVMQGHIQEGRLANRPMSGPEHIKEPPPPPPLALTDNTKKVNATKSFGIREQLAKNISAAEAAKLAQQAANAAGGTAPGSGNPAVGAGVSNTVGSRAGGIRSRLANPNPRDTESSTQPQAAPANTVQMAPSSYNYLANQANLKWKKVGVWEKMRNAFRAVRDGVPVSSYPEYKMVADQRRLKPARPTVVNGQVYPAQPPGSQGGVRDALMGNTPQQQQQQSSAPPPRASGPPAPGAVSGMSGGTGNANDISGKAPVGPPKPGSGFQYQPPQQQSIVNPRAATAPQSQPPAATAAPQAAPSPSAPATTPSTSPQASTHTGATQQPYTMASQPNSQATRPSMPSFGNAAGRLTMKYGTQQGAASGTAPAPVQAQTQPTGQPLPTNTGVARGRAPAPARQSPVGRALTRNAQQTAPPTAPATPPVAQQQPSTPAKPARSKGVRSAIQQAAPVTTDDSDDISTKLDNDIRQERHTFGNLDFRQQAKQRAAAENNPLDFTPAQHMAMLTSHGDKLNNMPESQHADYLQSAQSPKAPPVAQSTRRAPRFDSDTLTNAAQQATNSQPAQTNSSGVRSAIQQAAPSTPVQTPQAAPAPAPAAASTPVQPSAPAPVPATPKVPRVPKVPTAPITPTPAVASSPLPGVRESTNFSPELTQGIAAAKQRFSSMPSDQQNQHREGAERAPLTYNAASHIAIGSSHGQKLAQMPEAEHGDYMNSLKPTPSLNVGLPAMRVSGGSGGVRSAMSGGTRQSVGGVSAKPNRIRGNRLAANSLGVTGPQKLGTSRRGNGVVG